MQSAVFSFVQATRTQRVSYRDQHEQLRGALSRHPVFRQGRILDTLERGVAHPVLHIKELDHIKELAVDDLDFVKPCTLGPDITIWQGMYEEIEHLDPPGHDVEDGPDVGYILMGFQFLERSLAATLEHTWRDWSGARFIYLNLDDCFGMKRISLYQRVQPHCLELFKYILLVKCTNVNAQNTPELLEFVQRLRVKLLSAYISSYELCK